MFFWANTTIILRIVEPRVKRCYRIRNTSFSAKICWSNVAKYLLSVPIYGYCPSTAHIWAYVCSAPKSKFNYEFLRFLLRFWCKSHLFFMENPNLKKKKIWRARRARGSARAPFFFFFTFGFSIKNR